jgi:molecular chaperone DnaK
MERARDQITQASHKLAEAIYKRSANQEGGGAGGQQTSDPARGRNKDEGEVVDAEFEDVN